MLSPQEPCISEIDTCVLLLRCVCVEPPRSPHGTVNTASSPGSPTPPVYGSQVTSRLTDTRSITHLASRTPTHTQTSTDSTASPQTHNSSEATPTQRLDYAHLWTRVNSSSHFSTCASTWRNKASPDRPSSLTYDSRGSGQVGNSLLHTSPHLSTCA